LITINWFTWLYAVKTNNLLDGALGYYIFPILSVFFGIVFLNEKFNKNQVISILLVVTALIYLLVKLGQVPWIGIIVAITFSFYGLIRKNYLLNKDKNIAEGVYIFDNSKNAHLWFDQSRIKWLTERYSEPEVSYFYSPVEVNNSDNKINIS